MLKASKMLGVTTTTLRNWDRDGKIDVVRTPSNHRMISMEEISRLQGVTFEGDSVRTKTLVYARCSRGKQKDDLERQLKRLETWCNERNKDYEVYWEIGSALNGSRKEVKKLIRRMAKGDVKELVVEYGDRLTRVCLDYFIEFCNAMGVKLVCLEERDAKTFEEDMTADITGIILSYSARINGKRGAENKKKQINVV